MLDVSLGRLYRAIATWRPPTRRAAITCAACLSSPFRSAGPLEPLPEAVVHAFLIDLDRVVAERVAQLRDEREAAYAAVGLEWNPVDDRETPEELVDLVELADDETWEFLVQHRAEIDRMRMLYLEPRLGDWLDRMAIQLDVDERPDWLS